MINVTIIMVLFKILFQGVQAQTVSNFFLAFDKDLHIIPVLNKVTLFNSYPTGYNDKN